jgi:hypothetical protein
MNKNTVGRRIHTPTDGTSFKKANWNDCRLLGEQMKNEGSRKAMKAERGEGCQ